MRTKSASSSIRTRVMLSMRIWFFIALLLTLGNTSSMATDWATGHTSPILLRTTFRATADPAPEVEEHGLPPKAVELAHPFNFPITNSMVVSWIVALGLIVFAQVATRDMKQVPTGVQNFVEWLVEGLYKFMVGIIGQHLAQRTFWFFATIFIFILSANWIGLIPGVGTLG